jgi:hypothetical protein
MGTLAAATRNAMLDAFARNVSYANAAVWVKLHLGDPGAAGTTNAAAETTRKQATFGDAAASGAITNTAAVTAGDTFRIPVGDLDLTLT